MGHNGVEGNPTVTDREIGEVQVGQRAAIYARVLEAVVVGERDPHLHPLAPVRRDRAVGARGRARDVGLGRTCTSSSVLPWHAREARRTRQRPDQPAEPRCRWTETVFPRESVSFLTLVLLDDDRAR